MLYLFRAKDGSEITVERDWREAPTLGTPLRRKGKTYRRVIDLAPPLVQADIHFTSSQMPLNWRDKNGKPFNKSGYDARGQPRFGSMGEVTEAIVKAKDAGEPIHGYD